MGFLARILLMVSSAIGVACCVAAIIQLRDTIQLETKPDYMKGAIACLFIELLILSGLLIFLFITLCCACNDVVMGIIIAIGGGAAAVFAVISFGLLNKPSIDMGIGIPRASEWTFAGIFMGTSVLLIALTMAVS
ncbi:hypothetical protein EG68_02765 [Paragonimus skrjabini miyazakii]|uniref:Uncharacterized protein n=1 Tax=Paragonimus skrjabini miyazakii TaxID=59628 RepID=A0A8S9Z4H3_9TREM|nr:hypothetical protein EG68_02765 [Paragonimus skrjabini miyazakii]